MKFIVIFISIFFCSMLSYSQLLSVPLIVSDGTTIGKDTLWFGLDPTATDGIDSALGEYQLPPSPPTGIFDFRFIGTDLNPPLPIGEGLNKDFRQGIGTLQGFKIHELKFQRGIGTYISISWGFPSGVSGKLYDLFGGVIINDTMFGLGNKIITNGAINKLFMKIYYNRPISIGKYINGQNCSNYKLYSNFPNPFNPTTNIKFDIPKPSKVQLIIYDVLGREIVELLNKELKMGTYQVDWSAENYLSGVYFYKLEARQIGLSEEEYTETKKMILMK